MNVPERLRILAVLHTIYGVLILLAGLIGASVMMAMSGAIGGAFTAQWADDPPPEWLAGLFGAVGVGILVFVCGLGVLNILSGRWMERRMNRTGSIIIAAVDCLNMPLGIVLGVFTLVSLSDDRVIDAYRSIPSTGTIG
jgi:hypothetical protein